METKLNSELYLQFKRNVAILRQYAFPLLILAIILYYVWGYYKEWSLNSINRNEKTKKLIDEEKRQAYLKMQESLLKKSTEMKSEKKPVEKVEPTPEKKSVCYRLPTAVPGSSQFGSSNIRGMDDIKKRSNFSGPDRGMAGG
ncbi:hypothetical protein BB559_002901 [Furculomyces boomerangus]|uniref:Uncharacterized protein n=2 Tax=Harpellales TaxID=61421 RepID=A0A2T9YRE1_9FUNG|nr:hypothetical protein BB559_002901 [Furculomyces boomerangus]PVZ97793.1 hypothetical protein BB558_006223 [Smittium angustum]PVZ98829.1 hypothetical protein BB558_005165 [Smittium angustum]PVZ99755.1 hypothetical protein BB558_004203 [Smittium angustum]